ncbi:hypothetical protein LJC48_06955 [Desulfovibrio sp. OttesenSCG-928-C06]|nr:hypothetical protein [Desulfovibrio sp. OttesenSCG-928-C06]
MDTRSFYTRHMLLQYGRQLISSRRLSRYNQLMGLASGHEQLPAPDVQRRMMVDRISREVVENLIFTGSDNPVVQEVRQRLDDELDGKYLFQYPPGEIDFRIMRQEEDGSTVQVSSDEKHRIMGLLLDLTRETVSETML